VSKSRRQKSENRKRRIQRRLDGQILEHRAQPMFSASNVHYDVAERSRGLIAGGICVMHQLARKVGLVEVLDEASTPLALAELSAACRLRKATLCQALADLTRRGSLTKSGGRYSLTS